MRFLPIIILAVLAIALVGIFAIRQWFIRKRQAEDLALVHELSHLEDQKMQELTAARFAQQDHLYSYMHRNMRGSFDAAEHFEEAMSRLPEVHQKSPRQPDSERWERVVVKLHQRMRLHVLKAETDWDLLFSAPALTDVTVPQTAALYRAMRVAEDSIIDIPRDFTSSTPLTSVPYAVTLLDFETAWEIAYAHALRIGTNQVPAQELKTIALIKDLLAIAENRASAQPERLSAYSRIQKLLASLKHIHIPQRAVLEIETKRQLAIER